MIFPLVLCWGLLVAVPLTSAANILVVMPVPARSHSHLFSALAEGLAERGHNVTYFTAIEYKKSVKNLTQIVVQLDFKKEDIPNFFKTKMPAFAMVLFMPVMGSKQTERAMTSQQFQELIHNKGNAFDVVIVESFICDAIAATVAKRFSAPLIGYTGGMPNYFVNSMVGNEAPTSYIPELLANLPKKMSFLDRAWNFLVVNFATAYHQIVHYSLQDGLMRKYGSPDLPYIGDIIRNTSLMFVNDHFAISYPRPLVPNMIPIAGIHVKPPKPLPKDLQTIMDNSKNGVIFFSLGSNLKSADMDQDKQDMFLNTFAKLKETVVWKFEQDLPNKPNNVIISDWLPQSDILAHPNLKLFITHGGMLSTTESVERGVPLVGIPIFADQPANMRQSVNAGVGLALEYSTLTEDAIYNAIREVIDNPKYKEAAVSRSRQLHDKPMSAMDTAVYWVEYVIRHKGAPHLRSAVQDLAWYQANQLDVVAVLILTILVSLYIAKALICSCWRKLCRPKVTPSQAVKNKKKKN